MPDPLNISAPVAEHVNPMRLSEADYRDWLKSSRRGIGGSDVAALLGVSRWRTLAQVFDRVLGIAVAGVETPRMRRGTALEDDNLDEYRVATGRIINPGQFYRDDEVPYLIGHTDGDIVDPGTLYPPPGNGWGVWEGKCLAPEGFELVRLEGLSDDYHLQVQQYMGITKREWASVSILNPDDWALYWFDLPFSPAIFGEIRERAEAFWNDYVVPRIRPDDGTSVDVFPLPRVGNESIRVTEPADVQTIARFAAARENRLLAERAEKLARESVEALFERHDTEAIHAPGVLKLTWKWYDGRTTLDEEAMQRDGIDLTPYRKQGAPFRKLTPSKG